MSETDQTEHAAALAARLRAGDRAALARALTEMERLSPMATALLAAVAAELGRALVVGVTGPPGAGKSTLLGAYIARLRRADRSVGVIAVDPSSPISGGAILGDRLRMTRHAGDGGVFVRSLASGGHVGGLSPAAVRMIDAFDAAGRDVVLVETVGAGQSEIDIAEVADIRVVLAPPGLGDDIQAMKAGILDIADILVVTKADLPEAARTRQQLAGAVSLRGPAAPPVLMVSAQTGAGLEEFAQAVDGLAARRAATPLERRRRRARRLLAWAATALAEKRVREGAGPDMDALLDAVLGARISPDDAARTLMAREP